MAQELVAEAEALWSASGQRRMVSGAINTLGLIAEDDGDADEAIDLYTSAIEAARAVDAAMEVAWPSHDLGALLVELGRSAEAIEWLRGAVAYWAEAGNTLLRAKSEAYLGLALLESGTDSVEPSALADAGLELFRSGDYIAEQPQAWLWTLSRLLDRLGRQREADTLLDAAREDLVRQAATIADPERRRGFFQKVPLNRNIIAAVDARSDAARTVVVTLAHTEAPLGRTLRDDEVVEVRWTLHAADDEALADAAARRRHRLQRLLAEAAAQSAAPTDDDLAAALGVSRRTIIRDMQAIGDTASTATRRRSATAARSVP